MKICLVSAFPPSRRGLNEYGYHIARELQSDPLLSLTILADRLDSTQPELDDFDVVRCWDFNSLSNPIHVLRAIRELKPDVVWFNLLFSTFGSRAVAAFVGLTLPLLVRLSGTYTHITLHHLMDNVDLKHAGIRYPRSYRAAGYLATRMLLMANSISVLLPAYRRTLMQKYSGNNVHFRAHGILSARPEPPAFEKRGNPEHRILAFGKWGTYKRLELLIEAFEEISRRFPRARLVIAGGNHPNTAGYVEGVAKSVAGNPNIRFTGYVEEESVSGLFSSASVMVMPYSSATGSSGVAHMACEFGLPIVCADIEDFREMSLDEQLAIKFFKIGDAHSMADCIVELLESPAMQREMGEANFSAALRQTMPMIIRQYLRSFDMQHHHNALRPFSRFRRLPGWVPLRSTIFRATAPRWSPWT
ncbi:MAG TPA: glycosyltransferase [Candidatus Saccharimonadales bacterium]|nr:glycosyltransferase [Candidatus Saccharimonadales bacterium]